MFESAVMQHHTAYVVMFCIPETLLLYDGDLNVSLKDRKTETQKLFFSKEKILFLRFHERSGPNLAPEITMSHLL